MTEIATEFVIPAPPGPSLAVAGTQARFPVRRILCVGRNYANHAREMGSDPDREPPFFFMKPGDAVRDGGDIAYPPLTSNLHFEVELVVAIGKGGSDIAASGALEHVFGYAVGVDLTRRDLQNAAKAIGRPWDWGKAFDASAPCGAILPAAQAGDVTDADLWLSVNGDERQRGRTSDMIWPVADVIAIGSQAMKLAPGDLIFTGTPAGVGPLRPGDQVAARVAGLPPLDFTIVPPAQGS